MKLLIAVESKFENDASKTPISIYKTLYLKKVFENELKGHFRLTQGHRIQGGEHIPPVLVKKEN